MHVRGRRLEKLINLVERINSEKEVMKMQFYLRVCGLDENIKRWIDKFRIHYIGIDKLN